MIVRARVYHEGENLSSRQKVKKENMGALETVLRLWPVGLNDAVAISCQGRRNASTTGRPPNRRISRLLHTVARLFTYRRQASHFLLFVL